MGRPLSVAQLEDTSVLDRQEKRKERKQEKKAMKLQEKEKALKKQKIMRGKRAMKAAKAKQAKQAKQGKKWCVCGTNKRALELLQNHVVDSTVVELRAPHAVNRALHAGICYIESGVLHLTFLS